MSRTIERWPDQRRKDPRLLQLVADAKVSRGPKGLELFLSEVFRAVGDHEHCLGAPLLS